jgi:hypothetical protein
MLEFSPRQMMLWKTLSSTPRHHIDEEERTKQNYQIKNKEKRFDIQSIDIKSTDQDEDGAGGLAAAAAAAEESVTTVTIVVVDRRQSLVIEKKDDQNKIL